MKVLRYNRKGSVRWGALEDNGEHVREGVGDFLGDWGLTKKNFRLDGLDMLPPVEPTKVVALGLNYKDHAEETGMPLPEDPMIFMKPSTSVIGPGSEIVYPKMSERVDYEAELAIVMGKKAYHVDPEDARDHIFGYTCANDVTARDLQVKDGQWIRAKGFDTFCPLGPWIATDLDPEDVAVEAYLNGNKVQSSRTKHLIFSVDEIVSFVTHIMTLNVGDVIITGTPSGIGPMQPGDEIEVRIEGIGSLINKVAAQE